MPLSSTRPIYPERRFKMEREHFEAIQHRTCSDGWVETGPVYRRADGSTFMVPPKHVHSIIAGDYVTYGAYTQDELKKFSDEDLKKRSPNWQD